MKNYSTAFEAIELLAARHGEVLTNGGSPERFFFAVGVAKRIASQAGMELNDVLDAAREMAA